MLESFIKSASNSNKFTMRQLFVRSLCIFVGILANSGASSQTNDSKKENYRLNRDVVPLDYILDLTPYFDTNLNGKEPFTLDGLCTITIKATKSNVDSITLHKQHLNIVEQTLTPASNFNSTQNQMVETIGIKSNEYNNVTSKYTLKLTQALVKDEPYVLKFKYTGKIKDPPTGLVRVSYQDGNATKWLATTGLEPYHAREMFPCFDEPQFRATFSMIINRPAHFKPSLANTRLISSHATSANLVREYFEKSPPMPTYLVGIIVSELECRENEAKNFEICYRPSMRDQTEYNFELGQRVIELYDELFDYKYSTHMNKMTLGVIPNMSDTIGGMENWGLFTGQEAQMLVDPKHWSQKRQQAVAQLTVHEVSHMWFGNTITLAWWDNFWLKEGFTQYFEFYITAMFEPTWGMDQQLLAEHVHYVFDEDSLESVRPMNYNANTSDDLDEKYGPITYSKGASIVRMFNLALGDDRFKAGIRRYFKDNALTSAVPEQLYAAFQKEVGNDFNVSETWSSWVTQPGYPVLNVHLSSDRKHIEIIQKRFLRNNPNHQLKSLWKVPLTYASNNHNSDFSDTKPFAILSNESMEFDLKEPVDWIIFNVQQLGYYRVNYDDENWSAISNLLHKSHSTIHVMNRAQIVDDAMNLAKASLLGYEKALQIVSYLQNEVQYAPWMTAISSFAFILSRFEPNEEHIFKEFAVKLLSPTYDHYGFEPKANATHLDNIMRTNLLKYACLWGHKGCIAKAGVQYDQFVHGNASVHPDIAEAVYCAVVEYGSETQWNVLWEKFKIATNAAEKIAILSSLGCTKQTHLLEKYFELILSDEIPMEFKTAAITSTWTQKENLDFVIDFILPRYKRLNDAFETNQTVSILVALALQVIKTEQVDRIAEFAKKIEEEDDKQLKSVLDDAYFNLKWADKYVPIIKNVVQEMHLSD